MRSAVLVLALVLVGFSSGTATPPALAASADAVSSLRVTGFAGSPIRRTVRLGVVIGACTTRVDVARLVQGRRSVQIRLTQTVAAPPVTEIPTACPAIGLLRCVSVVLTEPLGKRSVLDLTSGVRFRPGSGTRRGVPGVGNTSCPPPGPVKP